MKDNLLFQTHHFTVRQASRYRIPGYLIVQSRAPCVHVADLSPDQGTDLTQCLGGAEALVQKILQPDRIYILKLGEESPQIHFHIFSRTQTIAAAYLAQVSEKRPYSGARIVDWVWHHHQSLGFTDEQIQDFVGKGRKIIQPVGGGNAGSVRAAPL